MLAYSYVCGYAGFGIRVTVRVRVTFRVGLGLVLGCVRVLVAVKLGLWSD